jgi:hypothetical protein
MVPWYLTLWRITWWVFSRLWAPLMALGWPLLALYGALEPRASDLAALDLHRGEFAVLVGTGPVEVPVSTHDLAWLLRDSALT